jgi:hypothetical protein
MACSNPGNNSAREENPSTISLQKDQFVVSVRESSLVSALQQDGWRRAKSSDRASFSLDCSAESMSAKSVPGDEKWFGVECYRNSPHGEVLGYTLSGAGPAHHVGMVISDMFYQSTAIDATRNKR